MAKPMKVPNVGGARNGKLKARPITCYPPSDELREQIETYAEKMNPQTTVSKLLIAGVREYMQRHPL